MAALLETSENGVVTLTFNRPDQLNALSDEMFESLGESLQRLGGAPDVGAIVLTGAGRAFSAGGDVKMMAARPASTFEERLERLRRKQHVAYLLKTTPKVVIAAVNGVAVGAGLSLALACDFRLAARSARFISGFRDVGLSGDLGASWLLTRLVGPAKARELMLRNVQLGAEQAKEIGLITEIVEDGDLRGEATRYARQFADGPRVALGYMKKNLVAAEYEPFATVLDLEAIHQTRTALTEDHAAAKRAFVERRAPSFVGR